MFYACLHFPKLSVLPAPCSGCFPIWNTQFSPPKSLLIRLTRHLIWAPFSTPCPLHPQLTFPTFGAYCLCVLYKPKIRQISRTKHLKMKCWMKEWMVLNTTCNLHDNGEKFMSNWSQEKTEQLITVGLVASLSTMNNAALNISVQFLWMGTLSWVYT